MLKLTLLRHAKSSWSISQLNDFDRPLKKRGYNDIFVMAQRYVDCEYGIPDFVLSSPALRAMTTAQLFCDGIAYPRAQIAQREEIYDASTVELYELLSNLEHKHQHVLLVGHNPGLTYLAVELAQLHTTNVPTAGLVHLKLKIDSWQQLKAGCGKLVNFDYPKRVEA